MFERNMVVRVERLEDVLGSGAAHNVHDFVRGHSSVGRQFFSVSFARRSVVAAMSPSLQAYSVSQVRKTCS